MAALVRQGAAVVSTNAETVAHTPKTFGIPLHTCIMSSSQQVNCSLHFAAELLQTVLMKILI